MAASKALLLTLVVVALGQDQHIPSEFYSSVVNMELLLKSELAILDRLDRFIVLSEEKVAFLKRERDRLRADIEGAEESPLVYVSNPVSAFLMTKRLVKDYQDIDELIRKGVGVDLIDGSTVLPTEEDLQGIAEGLSRLQDLYMMEATDLAKGNVYGHKLVRELTPDECYRVGLALAQGKYFTNANQWFREALRRWKAEDSPGISKFEILDYFTYSLTEDGEHEEAMKLTEELLKLDPKNAAVLSKKKVIQDWLDHVELNGRTAKPPRAVPHPLYEPLCRGDHQRPPSETFNLYCRYHMSTSPFLRLAPLKQEVVNLDPFVAVYHDAASDAEITKVIELGRPRINRSMVGDAAKKEVSKSRTSQNSWLTDYDHPVVAALSRRTKDMALGLDETAYESLQVNNYGIGGHYLPHYDWSREENPYPELNTGNRIATLMFYLSDVEEGGATVFPHLGVGVFPKKGTAIFWYNLRASGKGDEKTLHGACPVLIGSKWVANKWIHERHQEFVRPCDPDPEK
ncbi:prolyl 4-hydroxylase subunit alpha-1-like [Culex pipiens pallens]|uniref:prolyl 4-hydroxylase subunit alpha-1-like n=1 Tax=Culex pipiens pallens TaxID=42434 RepID=UPI001953B28C|nr:prolyl 4-hydroxylase subunit alpha-1-like [Culex pipiens pallens]